MSTDDPFDASWPHRPPAALVPFVDAGLLASADVHVARVLARLADDALDERVALGAAFAVRAVRHRSVVVDLATIEGTATTDVDAAIELTDLPWPAPVEWIDALRASPLVAVGDDDPSAAPLRLVDSSLYLDRYWVHERQIAADLLARAAQVPLIDHDRLRTDLDVLFEDPQPDLQRLAAAAAVLRSFSVVAGGPGTGKTTTVAKIVALLHRQPTSDGQPLRVALAAPTGKAAARLQEAVQADAADLPVDDEVREALRSVEASTLHRLLGWRRDNRSRFRHDRTNQLPHHAVIVDETSMVSLTQMARLLEAVRPSARLVLVGDPQQLTSVEAGAVLGDVVGPCAATLRMSENAADQLRSVTGHALDHEPTTGSGQVGDGIVVLRRVHRFGGAVGALARAIESGDPDDVIELLRDDANDDLRWLPVDAAASDSAGAAIRAVIAPPATEVVRAARANDARAALDAMRAAQILCAHRRGPHGVSHWRTEVERWLAEDVEDYHAAGWYAGRPLLVTENDYTLDLYNGDTGVVVDDGETLRCAFERRAGIVEVSPHRLSAVETLYAMTIHKSQGSQYGEVVVVLPDESSPILTRELLYTAVTRAQRAVTLIGTESAVRAAVDRPVSRASGLRRRLWT